MTERHPHPHIVEIPDDPAAVTRLVEHLTALLADLAEQLLPAPEPGEEQDWDQLPAAAAFYVHAATAAGAASQTRLMLLDPDSGALTDYVDGHWQRREELVGLVLPRLLAGPPVDASESPSVVNIRHRRRTRRRTR